MFAERTLQPMLPASDLARARGFYADVLDLKPFADEGGALRYRAGTGEFVLYESTFAGTNQATAAMWEVDDIADTVARLKARGLEFLEYEMDGFDMAESIATTPSGLRAAWFKDSEGNIIGLVESTS